MSTLAEPYSPEVKKHTPKGTLRAGYGAHFEANISVDTDYDKEVTIQPRVKFRENDYKNVVVKQLEEIKKGSGRFLLPAEAHKTGGDPMRQMYTPENHPINTPYQIDIKIISNIAALGSCENNTQLKILEPRYEDYWIGTPDDERLEKIKEDAGWD